ncbi:helix-turn-helix domain-containing protein [Terasakiispira papahanaumokuakeensis]|uniref:helix-turn-helix domain-containing protein n=1 Tax=Terasakiispira papahanaumokuakeensis TaxID=197479 RepID=UPI000A042438|nr:helix-turn-helix domain-containing protein [Terasakiispira papahanaumokuakeensis]
MHNADLGNDDSSHDDSGHDESEPRGADRPNVLEHVAENIRSLRQQQSISQQQLAERAEVSRRMLVGLEKGDVNVSLNTLDRIAEALSVSFSTLVSAPATPSSYHINALAWTGQSAQSQAVLLASVEAHQEVELWAWTLAPGEIYCSEPNPMGWKELYYVLEGTLSLYCGESASPELIPAQAWTVVEGSQAYQLANESSSVLRFMRNVMI